MNVKASALLFLISPKLSRTFLELFNVIVVANKKFGFGLMATRLQIIS